MTRRRENDPFEEAVERGIDEADAAFERERAVVERTRLITFEAAICECLASDKTPDFQALRERFEHRLEGIDEDTLGLLQVLVRGVAESLHSNDREALSELAAAGRTHLGLADEGSRIVQSYIGVLRFVRDGHIRQEWGPDLLRFSLGGYDERFRRLEPSFIRETLIPIEEMMVAARERGTNGQPKGGPGNTGPRRAYATLAAECGAFDVTSVEGAKKKINGAWNRLKRKFAVPDNIEYLDKL